MVARCFVRAAEEEDEQQSLPWIQMDHLRHQVFRFMFSVCLPFSWCSQPTGTCRSCSSLLFNLFLWTCKKYLCAPMGWRGFFYFLYIILLRYFFGVMYMFVVVIVVIGVVLVTSFLQIKGQCGRRWWPMIRQPGIWLNENIWFVSFGMHFGSSFNIYRCEMPCKFYIPLFIASSLVARRIRIIWRPLLHPAQTYFNFITYVITKHISFIYKMVERPTAHILKFIPLIKHCCG